MLIALKPRHVIVSLQPAVCMNCYREACHAGFCSVSFTTAWPDPSEELCSETVNFRCLWTIVLTCKFALKQVRLWFRLNHQIDTINQSFLTYSFFVSSRHPERVTGYYSLTNPSLSELTVLCELTRMLLSTPEIGREIQCALVVVPPP